MDFDERTLTLRALLDCSEPSARALSKAMRHKWHPAQSILSHQGHQETELWLVLSGTVQLQAISIEGRSTIISAFGPGDLVGAFSDNDESAFDVCAMNRVEALQIEALRLHHVLQEWPDLGVGLSAIYSGQLHSVLDRLAARVTLSAVGRCYRELLKQAGSRDVISPPPVISALALSAQTTRETGSRAISALERRGIIQRDETTLEIVSRRLLEDLVI